MTGVDASALTDHSIFGDADPMNRLLPYMITSRSRYWSDFPANNTPAQREDVRRKLFQDFLEVQPDCMWLMQRSWRQQWLVTGEIPAEVPGYCVRQAWADVELTLQTN